MEQGIRAYAMGWQNWLGILATGLLFVGGVVQAEGLSKNLAKNLATLPVAEARGGTVLITPQNTLALLPGNRRLARVVFPRSDIPVVVPVLGPRLNQPGHQLLRRLYAAGKAAGNDGDIYENRDRAHSRLPPEAHPQLTHVVYGDSFQARNLDYGGAVQMLFDAPLIGNSSTALAAGPLWRSLPRLMLTINGKTGFRPGPQNLYQNYAAGQIHVYPEHRDHDDELGDLLPANTPYYLISKGSSGSDQPHLQALAMILAALRPDTKAFLRQADLIAPTVQMIYRRARVGVRSGAAYLSGAAHPSVFDARDIDLVRMVGLANAIPPDAVPPMVRLRVTEDMKAREGVDYFGQGLSEVLFDTPSAIARVWRSRAGQRRMVVSAEATRDPNGRKLSFNWVLLRGDPARVTLTPLTPDGARVQIDLIWQAPRAAPGTPDVISSRIDIGVFANNGVYDSAPAFISVLLPRHETRRYETGPDGQLRVASIDWGPRDGVYADPLIFSEIPWRDDYHYDAAGQITGWTRIRPENGPKNGPDQVSTPDDYDANGWRILARDTQGIPMRTAPVRYLADQKTNRPTRLREELLE